MKKLITIILIQVLVIPIKAQVWTQKANFPGTAVVGFSAFTMGNKGYVCAGTDRTNYLKSFYEYDPLLNSWSSKANFPGIGRSATIACSDSNAAYVGMGWDGANRVTFSDIYKYDPSNNSWSFITNYPGLGKRNAFAGMINGKIYVGGGGGGSTGLNGILYTDFWEYDIAINSWTQKSNLPFSGRVGTSYFTIDSLLYVCFGHNHVTDYSELWAYNANSNSWTQKASFPGTGRLQAVSFILNGKVIAGGGHQVTMGTSSALNDYYSYDPVTNSWSVISGFSTSRRSLAEGISFGNRGFLIMGEDSLGNRLNDLWEYSLIPVTLDENKLSDKLIHVYPIPSNGSIQFKTKTGIRMHGSLRIRDINGKLIYDEQINLNTLPISIDLSQFPSSTYIYQFISENGQQERGIIPLIN